MKSLILKRSVFVGGRKSSVTLEEDFWSGLKEIARLKRQTVSRIIVQIDRSRDQDNLSSAVRSHVLAHYRSLQPDNAASASATD